MNCEAAMLKVCKLDINWAAEGWGAERVGVCSCAGDVTGFGHRLARSGEEAVDETLSRRVAEQWVNTQETSSLWVLAPLLHHLYEDGQVAALAVPHILPLCISWALTLLICTLSSSPRLVPFSPQFSPRNTMIQIKLLWKKLRLVKYCRLLRGFPEPSTKMLPHSRRRGTKRPGRGRWLWVGNRAGSRWPEVQAGAGALQKSRHSPPVLFLNI